MAKTLKYWLPVFVWATVIFIFSSISVPPASEIFWQDFVVKKTAHIVEYGILAILLYRAFVGCGKERKQALFFSFVTVVFYAAIDEIHQSFVPGREAKIRDVIIDTIGGSGGLYLVRTHI